MPYQLGTSASETLTGGAEDDYIVGNGGNDTLIGGGGADQLFGYTGVDLLDGGDGNDILLGDNGDDQLLGGAGSDQLNGGAGSDVLNGGDGDDVLILEYDAGTVSPSGSNIDYLTGGAGADRFVARGSSSSSIDHITDFSAAQGDRIDLLATNGASSYGNKPYVWTGAITRLDFTPTIGQSLDTGMGEGFAQVWTWANTTTTYVIIDVDDNHRIDFGDFVLALDGAVALDAASFVAGTFNTNVGTLGADVWSGSAANEAYFSGAGADTLSGLGGDDELHGGDGADAIDGGDGADVLLGEFGDDVLHGGQGNDMLYAGGRYNGQDDSQGSVNVLYGDDGDDFLSGSTGLDTMYGGAGDDTLSGGAGDKLYGGDGVDNLHIDTWLIGAAAGTLDGGAGDDVISLTATQIATGGAGADRFSLQFTPNGFSPTNPSGYATITDFNATEGDRLDFSQSYHYQLPVVWRGALDNPSFSLANGDTFSTSDYGPGFFQIWTWTQGGSTYLIVDTNNDGVLQYGVARPDYVLKFDGPVGLDAGAFLPSFLFTGVNGTSVADTVNGGANADTYYGVGGDDQLHGGASGDTLYGNNGADQIWGDDGDDSLSGGLGNDQLEGGAGYDQIWGGAGSDVIHGGEGADTLAGSGTAPGDQDATTDINLIYGEGGDDQISGGGAHDEAYGGDGNDQIYANGLLYGENGDDRLSAGSASTLDGGAGNDSLNGGSYDDVLDGGAGADSLWGGYGKDVLHVDLGDSSVNGGDGDDLILVSGLRAGETATLGATPGVYVSGDYGDDRFVILADLSAGGVISFNGGPGGYSSESYDGHDELDLSHATGAVTVDLSQTAAQQTGLGAFILYQIEDVRASDYGSTLTGDAHNNALTGGAGEDWLISAGGADQLSGGDGHDSVWGGAGDDLLEGGEGDDTIDGGAGIDTVVYAQATTRVEIDLSFMEDQLTRGAGVDTLISIENVIGSAFDDRLMGGAGANALTGGAGADSLIGGDGADRFVYTALSDSTVAARDVIADFTRGLDRIDLSALDASSATVGDQAFHLGATAGHEGDIVVTYDGLSGQTSVSLYVDGDATADAMIMLVGNLTALAASDFIL